MPMWTKLRQLAYHQGNGGSASRNKNITQEELNEMGYEVGEVQTTSKTIQKDLLKEKYKHLKQEN